MGNRQLQGDRTDQPLTPLNLEDARGSMSCVDEASACGPDDGGVFVINLARLEDLVVVLAR
jgi:hypothetical protein